MNNPTHKIDSREVTRRVDELRRVIEKDRKESISKNEPYFYYQSIGVTVASRLSITSMGQLASSKGVNMDPDEIMRKFKDPSLAVMAMIAGHFPDVFEDMARTALQSAAIVLAEQVFNPGELEQILAGRRQLREQGIQP